MESTHRTCANRRPLSALFLGPREQWEGEMTPESHCCCELFSEAVAFPIDGAACKTLYVPTSGDGDYSVA